MAAISMSGSGSAAAIAEYLSEKIQSSGLSCQLLDSAHHCAAGTELILMVFEKYYYRAGNRASLTVSIFCAAGRVTVDAIGSGGGQGPIFRMSWGAEEDFVEVLEQALLEKGFK